MSTEHRGGQPPLNTARDASVPPPRHAERGVAGVEPGAEHGRGPAQAVTVGADGSARPPAQPVDVDLEPTGDEVVDEALEPLSSLPDRDTGAHAELYEEVHRRLHEALDELDG